jgi:hypothetical protein
MDPPSMIITTVRAFLRPLPSIIFSPNSLSNRWISHIEKAKEKTAQMGEVSDAAPCPLHGREELDETENDHHIFGRDREEEIDVDETVREEPTEGQKYSIDCSGGSNHGDKLIWSKNDRTDTSTDSAEEKVSQELSRSPIAF